MLRLFTLVAALLGSLLLTAAPSAIAANYQTPTVDIATTASTVSGIDPQELATALESPIAADALPRGFTSAVFFDPDTTPGASDQPSDQGIIPTTQIPGTEASVAYTVEGDTSVLGGIATINSLNYVIVDPAQMGDDVLGDIREGVEQGLATPVPGGTEVGIEEVELGGAPALLLTFTVADASANAVVQMHIVPVGNVIVVGLVTVADQTQVNPADVLVPSQELTLAGISHLATIAQGLSA
jgi:hypothetical protein